MAKKKQLPKKIAGVKVPKGLRRSKILRSMVRSDVGRDVLAKAITAGAGAAAAVLVDHRDDVFDARTAKKGRKAVGLARRAMQSGFSAAMDAMKDSVFPETHKPKKAKSKTQRRAVVH
ncbi:MULTISPECIES: hypothetical protein [Sinorhizobium]|uniref:Uncharacterized protein n=2 Tax=Sinorhizobium TaxID=28105 RepID=A0A1L3LQI7_9HYPH|nr:MULTISPECIES: hypothetical protein [Sinorhizobium]APG85702.1 hypothetical protein SAMCCGM7_Ch2972 [Sinorhizobium americanum CCGM7]APG92360.1 hypothetical protein SAMCFNEI73_Ch3095 [Sinorhizobium americanum]ASY58060.1 hypothetical protein SS05631_c31380 [Sinorhizobium sp. CCBAU 05631]AUX77739.1 hypothetical protein NXT3_CH03194 [Sinorhizobium fredii]OAP41699.1 hypothetical protein ATC00_07800 [Sinorhizobium americanum]